MATKYTNFHLLFLLKIVMIFVSGIKSFYHLLKEHPDLENFILTRF